MDKSQAIISREADQLIEFVKKHRERLSTAVFDPRLPRPIEGADRWLLASLVQKAVRRGDIDTARQAGHQLLRLDPTRLWRRLMVVGLEDIGIGDPEAVCLVIALSALPQARALLASPLAALDSILQIACYAVKERSGDAFGSITKEMEDQNCHSLLELSQSAKIAVLSYGHVPWRRRLRAAYLLGREWAPAEQRKALFIELSHAFRAAGTPELLLSACLLYCGKSDDRLPLYVPLIYSLWLAQGAPKSVRTVSCQSTLLRDVPSYGFDPLHTRLGRRAVEVWLKSYLSAPPFSASQVAIALWNMEAAASQRLLEWPLGEEIRAQGHTADLLTRGLILSRHVEIDLWIKEQFAVLQHARSAIWEGACSAMRERLPRAETLEQTGDSKDG